MSKLSTGKKWLQRVGYALSGFGSQVPKTLVDTFASVFLVTAAGLSAGNIAIMLLVTKIIDGITDYLMGIAIDATKCKFGKNRLWMLVSIPVTFVGVVALFMSPGAFSYGEKLAWAYLAYILVTLGLTMAQVAANAIIPFLSSDPGERGILVSSKLLLSMVGSMGIAGMVSALVNLTGGADAVSGYTKAAIAIGFIFAIIIAFAVLTLKEKNYEISSEGEKIKSNPIKDLGTLFSNKNYIIVLVLGFCCMFIQICMTTGAAYYAGYALKNDGLTGNILMPVMGGAIIPMLLMGTLAKKFSKKNLVTIGGVFGIIFCIAIILVGSNGAALTLFSLLEGISFGIAYVIFFTMQPDVVDEVAYKSGRVMSGLQAALAGFACNIGSAVAAASVTGLIGKAGFDASLSVQPTAVGTAAKLGAFILPMAAMVVALIAVRFYDLDDHYDEIRKALGKPQHEGGEGKVK